MTVKSDNRSNEPVRGLLIQLDNSFEPGGVDFADIAAAYKDLRMVLLGLAVACVGLVLTAYFLTEKKFQAVATIVAIERSQGSAQLGAIGAQIGGLASLAGITLPNSAGFKVEAYATLESRELLRELIVAENLLPILFHDQWNPATLEWSVDTNLIPSIEDAVKFLQESVVTIKRDPGSSIVDVVVEWTEPELCAKWAMEIVRRANAKLRRRAIDEANKSIEFLENEFKKSSVTAIQNASSVLIEQQMGNVMMASVRTDYAFRVIDPATRPDQDSPVSPKLILVMLAGFFLWVLLGATLIYTIAVRNHAE